MTTIRVSSSVNLEARWDTPEQPTSGVVLCHPHPLLGGNMEVPLLRTITDYLAQKSVAVLRFNFRGVGGSTGSHDDGLAEIDDIAAAIAHARGRFPDIEFGIAGWSFGAATALRWCARDRAELNYVGIATAMGPHSTQRLPDPESLQPATRTFIVGDHDQVVPPDLVIDYARRAGATIRIIEGGDHFFFKHEREIAQLVASGLDAPLPSGSAGASFE